ELRPDVGHRGRGARTRIGEGERGHGAEATQATKLWRPVASRVASGAEASRSIANARAAIATSVRSIPPTNSHVIGVPWSNSLHARAVPIAISTMLSAVVSSGIRHELHRPSAASISQVRPGMATNDATTRDVSGVRVHGQCAIADEGSRYSHALTRHN